MDSAIKRKQLSHEFVYDSDDEQRDDLLATESPMKNTKANGLQKLVPLSDTLQKIIPEKELPRTEVIKRLHVHFKTIRDPSDGRFVLCDEVLSEICLGKERISTFEVMRYLSPHMGGKPLDMDALQEKRTGPKRKKPKIKVEKKVQKEKKEPTGLMKPLLLSDQLKAVVGDQMLARPTIIKELWVYIKANQLQDPKDGRFILSDSKLQQIFGQKRFSSFQMSKLLSQHCWHADEVVE